MSSQNFKVKNGLDVNGVQIIAANGSLTGPALTQITNAISSSSDTWVRNQANAAFDTANTALACTSVALATSAAAFDAANNKLLSELGDVDFSVFIPLDGTVLTWSDSSSAWIPLQTNITAAQAAFAHANVAFDTANTASDTVFSLETYTQSGFSHANSAYDAANTAYNYADSAYGEANSAYSYAGTVDTYAQYTFSHANSSYEQANTATTIGSAAYDQANTGTTIGSAAYDQANTGTTLAQAAFDTANNALLSIPSLSGYATESYVGTQIANLVDSAPTTLDTLNELAAALGDDVNFSTTVSNNIGLARNTANAAYDQANTNAGEIAIIQSVNDTQNSAISTLQSVDGTQNTRLSGVETLSQAAFDQANTDYTTISTTSGVYGGSTAIPVITLSANGRVSNITNTSITTGTTITDETLSASTYYPLMTTATSGSISVANTSNSKLSFVPSTGTLTTVDLNTTSDAQYKENVETILDPMNILNNINGVSFNWKDSGNKSYGVIAQELQKVLPELVKQGDQGLSVSYIPLIAILIEGIKHQNIRISQLESIINKQ